MALKATFLDDDGTFHLMIGLNRENVASLLDGNVFTLPRSEGIKLTEDSDIVLVFAETDEQLVAGLPKKLPTM